MDNTEKLLRAFIEASGYEIETLIDRKETPISKQLGESGIAACAMHGKTNGLVSNGGAYKRGDDGCYYLKPSLEVDCKVTKKGNLFILTDAQLDKLQDVLADHSDCGPYGSGWNSPELDALIEVFHNE